MKNMSGRASLLVAAAVLSACAAPQQTTQQPAADSKSQAELDLHSEQRAQKIEARREENAAQPTRIPAVQPVAEMVVAHSAISGAVASPAIACCPVPYSQPTNTERYEHLDDSAVKLAAEHPVSTFSIDVDTGAYANVRRFLTAGQLPPQDAVRVEEMINYFDYQYTAPTNRQTPFSVSTEMTAAPWNKEALLLKIGIKGMEVAAEERPAANLVFLIDVSGSMQSPDKLPLLKSAFGLLTDQLTARDRVSIVVYAGSSGVVLEPTPGDQKRKILDAIGRLEAGGSTNGAEGITRAYDLARAGLVKGGINRVVLATDGDFNVGVVNFEALIDLAEQERTSGVALTTLGFGTGNYNDHLIEQLANAGNGNYSYIDTLSEARKVLVSELSSTLVTIAKDVKIQVEFNPAEVLEYRLIGYENRVLAREDFNNDKVDAGEIGAGHRVTALYEVVPVGAKGRVDDLRYGKPTVASGVKGELAHVRLRYKAPEGDSSQLLEFPVRKSAVAALEQSSNDFRFAVSVAAFGQLLRGGKYVGSFDFDDVHELASRSVAVDRDGYRREFLSLVKTASSLAAGEERVSKIAE
jgi:Ca-activated chloride channel family protein